MAKKELELNIELVKMKKDIEYIKQAIDENTQQHRDIMSSFDKYAEELKEVLDAKADKEDFDYLREDYNSFKNKAIFGFISLLIGILSMILSGLISKVFH